MRLKDAQKFIKIQQITPLNSLALKVYHSPMMPVNKMNLWDETNTKHEHIFRDWHFPDVDMPKFQWQFNWDSTAGCPGTGGGPHPLRCEVDLGWYQRRSSPQGQLSTDQPINGSCAYCSTFWGLMLISLICLTIP